MTDNAQRALGGPCKWCKGPVAPGTRHQPTLPFRPCVVEQQIAQVLCENCLTAFPAFTKEELVALERCPVCDTTIHGGHAVNPLIHVVG